MTKLNEVQDKIENASVKNEYSQAILESIHDIWDDIVKYSNSKEEEYLALYEVRRVAARTENLLNLLGDLLLDSSELNQKISTQLGQLKKGEIEVAE